jgi:drug/metabolite transporter (DMT)-like permease
MLFALPGVFVLAQRAARIVWGFGAFWASLAGVAFAGDLLFWHSSMNHTSAANATFLVCGLSPVWVALFSVAFYRLRYRWFGWAGQALSLTGAMVIALAKGARVGTGRGEVLAVGASVCYAIFSLTVSRSRRTVCAEHSLFWMSLGSLVVFLLGLIFEPRPLSGYSLQAWGSLLGLGMIVQILAWWLITRGLGKVDVSLAALGLGVQQIATPFLGAWLLGESLRPVGLLGGVIILAGIYLVATGVRPTSAS